MQQLTQVPPFFIQMTTLVHFYINYTKQTISYLKILVCFVLKASPWLLASKVIFYFILTPFPARCKLIIWLLCGQFLLKFCPLRLWPVKHVSQGPCRRHLRSWWTQQKGRTEGPGIPAWHKTRKHLPFVIWQVLYQTPFTQLTEARTWWQALALPSPQFLPQLQVAVTNP